MINCFTSISLFKITSSRVDKAQLAQQAQTNPESLNAAPVQDGAYNINFNYEDLNYNFESNGEYWTWSYGQGSNASAQQVEQPQQAQQTEQAPVQQEAAPQTETTQQPQQETTTQASSSSNESSASEGSSVNVNAHLQAIAQRESDGDLKAVNPSSGAAGKHQFLQSIWDSVAPAEYKGVSPTEAPEAV